MIILQTRTGDAWRNIHTFETVIPAQIDLVRRSKLVARLWDKAEARVLAESLPAKGIPVEGLKPADLEQALTTFG
jgi:hypothetical protein